MYFRYFRLLYLLLSLLTENVHCFNFNNVKLEISTLLNLPGEFARSSMPQNLSKREGERFVSM